MNSEAVFWCDARPLRAGVRGWQQAGREEAGMEGREREGREEIEERGEGGRRRSVTIATA